MTQPHNAPNPLDAMMAFWKEAWSRSGAPAAAAPSASAPATGADPLGWMPTPDQVRRMQSAFMDAMAQSAEHYMRSPQFLESMKSSLENAVQMRRQMEEHVRRSMGEALHGTDGPGVLGALIEMEARLNARIDELAARLGGAGGGGSDQTDDGDTTPGRARGGTRPRRTRRGS